MSLINLNINSIHQRTNRAKGDSNYCPTASSLNSCIFFWQRSWWNLCLCMHFPSCLFWSYWNVGSVLANWQLQGLCCTEHEACLLCSVISSSPDLKQRVAPGPKGLLAYSLGCSPETPGRGCKQMCPCALPGVLPSVQGAALDDSRGKNNTRKGKRKNSKYWLYRTGNKRAMKLI